MPTPKRYSSMDEFTEAEHWFVRMLEPDCPVHEREACKRWRDADPSNAAAYRRVERIWTQSEKAAQNPAVMAAAERALVSGNQEAGRVQRFWRPATALAAAAIIAMVIVFVPEWSREVGPPAGYRYATGIGEQRNIELTDGSSITLDTSTTLIERYTAEERRVDLKGGRAHFRVRSNSERPFLVHVLGGTVTALGTEFQVRFDNSEAMVSLLEGRVAVASQGGSKDAGHKVVLNSGEKLTFKHGGQVGPVTPVDLEAARGWIEGMLFVDDWQLQELLAEMNRYTDTQLRIGDPSLDNIRISGTFRVGDQETLVLVLQQGWPILAVRRSPKEIVLYHR